MTAYRTIRQGLSSATKPGTGICSEGVTRQSSVDRHKGASTDLQFVWVGGILAWQLIVQWVSSHGHVLRHQPEAAVLMFCDIFCIVDSVEVLRA
jgi:hypothetical protein